MYTTEFFWWSPVLFRKAREHFETARHLFLTAYDVATCSKSHSASTARCFGLSNPVQTLLHTQDAHSTPRLVPPTGARRPPTSPRCYDKWRASVSARARLRVLVFTRFQCACVCQSARASTCFRMCVCLCTHVLTAFAFPSLYVRVVFVHSLSSCLCSYCGSLML